MQISEAVVGARAFPIVVPDDAAIQIAQDMRSRRDKVYPNLYSEVDGDLRWCGELGELCLDFWLKSKSCSFNWLSGDHGSGSPDFVVGGYTIGAKTVKRKVPIARLDYTAQISKKHADEPSDGFFFMSYEFPNNRMWLLGAISKKRFLEEAVFYGPGEQVQPNYTVREGHAIYNIEIRHLMPPDQWLKTLETAKT